MATNLVKLQTVEQLSPLVLRVLGCNPSPMTLQGTNTYLIGKGNKRILLDAGQGVPQYIDELKGAMAKDNISLQAILITHWHPDHIYGIKDVLKLVNQPELSVYKRKLLQMPDMTKLEKYGMPKDPDTVANFTFINNDNEPFTIETQGAQLKAIYTPGHTTDHLCYWLEEEQALFAGDTILGQGTTEFEDLYDYLNSLQLILNLSPRRIYPGHGPVVENPRETIEHYISHRQQRNDQILAALKQSADGLNPEEITQIVYKEDIEELYNTTLISKGGQIFAYMAQSSPCRRPSSRNEERSFVGDLLYITAEEKNLVKDLAEALFPAACHNVRNHLQMLDKQGLVHFNNTSNKWSVRVNSSI